MMLVWAALYLPEGRFDRQDTLARIRHYLETDARRLAADMSWNLSHPPGYEDLPDYEASLNTFIDSQSPPVVCMYDISRFDALMLFDVMRAHPALFIGNV